MARGTKAAKRTYAFKADAIVELRQAGKSWAVVAEALNLKGPGAARTAYTDLTGKHHNDIEGAPAVARKTSSNGEAKPRKRKASGKVTDAVGIVDTRRFSPGWNADTDQDDIIARLKPGTVVVVKRQHGTEEIQVQSLVGFQFNKDETRLAVEFHQTLNGGYRCVYVDDIIEVV
jgi:hypothetical protein